MVTTSIAAVSLALLLSPSLSLAQSTAPQARKRKAQTTESAGASSSSVDDGTSEPTPDPTLEPTQKDSTQTKPGTADLPQAPGTPSTAQQVPDGSQLKQTHRIFGVVPNFTAVDPNAQLPRLSTKEKFVVAMHDSMDYSSFVLVGILSAESLRTNSFPELGDGAAGFGRYYWRGFTDQVSGTFFTEAIVPMLTHEDPRYYTLGKGGFFRRTGYALSRVVVTKTDSGSDSFNISEIGGNALEAGLSNAYYPPEERGAVKTTENWATQTVVTGAANVLKEFWPDIRRNVLRQK